MTNKIRQIFVVGAGALLLVGCGSSSDGSAGAGGHGGRGGPGGPITVGYVVVQQGSAPIEQQLPGRVAAYQVSKSGHRSRASSQSGCSRRARSSARGRRSIRSIPASITRRPRRRRPICRARGPARKRRGRVPPAISRWSKRRRSPSRIIPTRRPGAPGRRFGRAELGGAAERANQPALHPRSGADLRADRAVQRHRGRARHRQPGGCADHHHAP